MLGGGDYNSPAMLKTPHALGIKSFTQSANDLEAFLTLTISSEDSRAQVACGTGVHETFGESLSYVATPPAYPMGHPCKVNGKVETAWC